MTKISFADGVDKVHIYLNNKLLKTVTEGNHDSLTIDVNLEDTLKFFCWTDWKEHFNATLLTKNNKDSYILTMWGGKDSQNVKKFNYYPDRNSMNKKITFSLDYYFNQLKPWDFITITLKSPLEQAPDHTKFDSTLIGKTIEQALDILKIDTTYTSIFNEPETKVHGLMILTSDYYDVTLFFTKPVIGPIGLKKEFLPLIIGRVCHRDKWWEEKCWRRQK